MKSARIQLALALLLLIGCLVGYFFWYQMVAAASQRAATLVSSIASASSANAKAQASRAGQSGLENAASTVDGYFLADADVVPFLENLQGLGSAVGANVSVVSVSAGSSGTQTLNVALHIIGSFAAVARAAAAIEYAPYDLSETSLTITSDGKGSWHADMGLSVGTRSASTTPQKTSP
ncbi:MAG: hypothetical protein ACREGR_02325 [Minisyncoccia bacterium]